LYKPPYKQPFLSKYENQNPVEIRRENEKVKVRRVARRKRKKRPGRLLFLFLLAMLYIYASSALFIFKGPYKHLKDFAIESILTSQHPKQWLALFSLNTVSATELQKYTALSQSGPVDDSLDASSLKDYGNVSDSSIKHEQYKGDTFTADILLIRDPKRVKVGVTNQIGKVGQTISEMVKDNHAVAGINGGSFQDVGWRGTGGIPLGTTIHNGKVVGTGKNDNVIGITKSGELITGKYSIDKLKELGVNEALSFGPILVKDGKGIVQGAGGWGNAPRTAIGQKEDGTIIMVVTDGRFVHGPDNLGASIRDIQNLMLKYGAVTAVNLDGGSSATMVLNGKLINEPSDVLGERKVATGFLVMPE
jgi:exopolysaccharide biosynthesis protein